MSEWDFQDTVRGVKGEVTKKKRGMVNDSLEQNHVSSEPALPSDKDQLVPESDKILSKGSHPTRLSNGIPESHIKDPSIADDRRESENHLNGLPLPPESNSLEDEEEHDEMNDEKDNSPRLSTSSIPAEGIDKLAIPTPSELEKFEVIADEAMEDNPELRPQLSKPSNFPSSLPTTKSTSLVSVIIPVLHRVSSHCSLLVSV